MIRAGYIILFLFSSLLLSAQESFPGSLTVSSPQMGEKVYLHIDRDIYNPGEDIWFKAYVIDFLTNKPSDNTNNLHVDLISPESLIIQHKTIRINGGLGKGDFRLSDSLPSGTYQVRAYTNYMRNFGEEFFYKKEIVLLNSNENLSLQDSISFVQDRLYLDFFPEGGSLVDNVTSVVAFKATNALGKGVDIKGQVLSETGELITSIDSTYLGMGIFMLTPLEGIEYYVSAVTPDGKSYSADLPSSFPLGLVLHAFILADNKLLVKINTNKNTLPSYYNKDIMLTISIRDLYTTSINLKLTSTTNNFSIPLDKFPEGVLKLTLFNPEGRPAAERLVFNYKSQNIKIDIASDRQIYKLREPINATVSISGNSTSQAYLSLSAADSRMLADSADYASNIASWFLLESEVVGPVENPGSYFDQENEKRFEQLDLLLLTQGWRDFSWKYDTKNLFEHEIGFTLKGNVKRSLTGKPFPLAKVSVAVFDEKKAIFLSKEADSSGFFMADKLDISGRARILASSANQKNNLTGWIFIDSMFYDPPEAKYYLKEKFELQSARVVQLFEEQREIELYKRKFKLSDTILVGEVFVTAQKVDRTAEISLRSSRALYGQPDREYVLSDRHKYYPDISQVLVGTIAGVEVNTITNTVTLRGETPLLLIDGVPVGNELGPGGATLPYLSPSEVDRIDILFWSSPFGTKGANGVINFITKRGDYNYEALNVTHSKYIYYKGFDEPRIFFSPVHESKYSEGQTPDFRNTLFWEPDLNIEANGKASVNYYNADKETTVTLKVEGITGDGIPLIGTYKYSVEK